MVTNIRPDNNFNNGLTCDFCLDICKSVGGKDFIIHDIIVMTSVLSLVFVYALVVNVKPVK